MAEAAVGPIWDRREEGGFASAAPSAAPRDVRVGVVDIGSNSIRLVVYDRACRAPDVIFNEKAMCALGRGVGETGHLHREGVASAEETLRRFAKLAESMGVPRIEAVATAAVREAEDGAAFLARITGLTGLPIRVLPGEEEARLSALGVLSGTPEADGVVGDLGGGSLEVVAVGPAAGVPEDGSNPLGAIGRHETLPLGPFRLGPEREDRAALIKQIDGHLDRVGWIEVARDRNLYAVGGAWRAFARVHMEHVGYPLHILHHYAIDGARAAEFAALVSRQSRSSLERVPGVSRRRLEVLPLASLVLERLLQRTRPRRLVFSASGLREGVLFDLLSPEERAREPLVAATDRVARRIGRFGDAAVLDGWTVPLFPDETAAQRRLRRAACALSDLAWGEHPDYRAEHAFLRVLRMPFSGVDHPGRAFLALATYVRHVGEDEPDAASSARRLLPPPEVERATVLGLALRLAYTLSGGAVKLVARTRLDLAPKLLTLTLPDDLAPLAADIVQRRLRALARALDRTGEVAVTLQDGAGAVA